MEDCSAATQNLLLAARALGLGAVWTGIYPMDGHVAGFTKHCQLPEGVVPLAFVVVGHPAEEPPAQNRFSKDKDPLKRVVTSVGLSTLLVREGLPALPPGL